MRHVLTRRQLYDMIWGRAVSKVAPELGTSDVALRKQCVKHTIPLPDATYWGQRHAGRSVKRRPLGVAPKGVSDRIVIDARAKPPAPEWPEGVELRPGRGSVTGRAAAERRTVHVPDVLTDPDYELFATQEHGGFRAALGVPMLREGAPIGTINVARARAQRFSDRQIGLLQTFADQAVIAIENVRLFKELEARNRALTESLEQQTATSDILRVISSSPTNVQPVFDTIVAVAAAVAAWRGRGDFARNSLPRRRARRLRRRRTVRPRRSVPANDDEAPHDAARAC